MEKGPVTETTIVLDSERGEDLSNNHLDMDRGGRKEGRELREDQIKFFVLGVEGV